jgi:hypothetical protein
MALRRPCPPRFTLLLMLGVVWPQALGSSGPVRHAVWENCALGACDDAGSQAGRPPAGAGRLHLRGGPAEAPLLSRLEVDRLADRAGAGPDAAAAASAAPRALRAAGIARLRGGGKGGCKAKHLGRAKEGRRKMLEKHSHRNLELGARYNATAAERRVLDARSPRWIAEPTQKRVPGTSASPRTAPCYQLFAALAPARPAALSARARPQTTTTTPTRSPRGRSRRRCGASGARSPRPTNRSRAAASSLSPRRAPRPTAPPRSPTPIRSPCRTRPRPAARRTARDPPHGS